MQGRWRRWLLLMVWAWPLFALAQTVTLTAIDQNPRDKSWVVRFDSSALLKVHHFILPHPERVVIDLSGGTALKTQINPARLYGTPVKQIRSSRQSPQSLRIVLDLNPGISARSLRLSFGSTQSAAMTAKSPPKKTIRVSIHRPREIIVVVDPGHGGKDPGATGLKKIQEKDIVLGISKRLRHLINQQPGFKAILTRDGDYYLTLRQRLAIARKNKADMFVAIHADAYPDPLAHGVSVFALSQRGATSEAARWLADRENQSELMGGVDLGDKGDMLRSVLINLSQTATIQASLLIGQTMLEHIQVFAYLHHNHLEQAAFVVLKSPDIPSLLVETGFLSNYREEEKLRSESYQNHLAEAIMLGVKQYFIHRPPPGTWLAERDGRFKTTG